MKFAFFFKSVLIATLSIAMVALSGFDTKTTTVLTNHDWTPWSQWFATIDCYKGISYRFRQRDATDDKNQIQIEFKNSYARDMTISYFATTDTAEYRYAIYRFDLAAGKTITKENIVQKNKKVYLYVANLRFVGDRYGDAYRGCGKGKQVMWLGHPEVNNN